MVATAAQIAANRANARRSTGPRTPEGKAAVAGNAITHGLRAKKHLLYFERYADFDRICRDLTAEWLPATPTEAALVEQMAIAQAKLVRLESNLSAAFYQSILMRAAACEDQFTSEDGTVKPPDVITAREFDVQRLINGLSQHIARVERSWHKALDSLQKLQRLRRAEPRPSAPPACQEPVVESSDSVELPLKNVERSHQGGESIPSNGGIGLHASGGAEETDVTKTVKSAGSALPAQNQAAISVGVPSHVPKSRHFFGFAETVPASKAAEAP